jgi:hypothetical protein
VPAAVVPSRAVLARVAIGLVALAGCVALPAAAGAQGTGGSDGARRGEEVGDGVGVACGCAPPVPPWADAAAAVNSASRTASSANAGTKAAFVVLAYVPFPQRLRAAGPRAPGNTAPDLVEAYGVS